MLKAKYKITGTNGSDHEVVINISDGMTVRDWIINHLDISDSITYTEECLCYIYYGIEFTVKSYYENLYYGKLVSSDIRTPMNYDSAQMARVNIMEIIRENFVLIKTDQLINDMSPMQCPQCDGIVMLDQSRMIHENQKMYCPYCGELVVMPDNEE